jgi:6-phosphofructokinase 1
MARIGILTSGGDCPGLNRAIISVIEAVESAGSEPIGIRNGFQGLLQASSSRRAEVSMRGVNRRQVSRMGGTFLGTSRTNLKKDVLPQALTGVAKLSLDGLVVIGGDGSLQSAARLARSLPVVGIPKTIDNDVLATELSIGFQTAVSTAHNSLERIQDTATSHRNCFIVEVMGRRSGFLAAASARAAQTDALVVPEQDWALTDLIAELRPGRVVVLAEGSWSRDLGERPPSSRSDQYGGIVERVASAVREASPRLPLRTSNLGHTLRGGPPATPDQLLADTMGRLAAEIVLTENSGLCVVKKSRTVVVDINQALKGRKFMSEDDLSAVSHMLVGRKPFN